MSLPVVLAALAGRPTDSSRGLPGGPGVAAIGSPNDEPFGLAGGEGSGVASVGAFLSASPSSSGLGGGR